MKKPRAKKKRSQLDIDTYDLGNSLCTWLLPRFKRFRFFNDKYIKTPKSLQRDFDIIEYALTKVKEDDFFNDEKVQKGLKLLGKHLTGMWW